MAASGDRALKTDSTLQSGYFRPRDFEFVQPLYDLAFLLEVGALANGSEVPKYRTFSLWRAGYSLDGYGTTIDRWLDGEIGETDLDYVPSFRIRQYLEHVRKTGTLSELRSYTAQRYERALRLRAVRGLGPSQIAVTLSSTSLDDEWFSETAMEIALDRDRIAQLYSAADTGPWQAAHVIPPLLRCLNRIEQSLGRTLRWHVQGISGSFEPITEALSVCADAPLADIRRAVDTAFKAERHFRQKSTIGDLAFRHQLGWMFTLREKCERAEVFETVDELATRLDPLSVPLDRTIKSDLHLHTSWSDGSATLDTMAKAVVANGLEYFAVTDHSRSSKLQNGLTPPLWLRQASALTLSSPICPILHGIEVDILRDGALDLPLTLLSAADLVVASVHTPWTRDPRQNTDRLLRAIESGCIDVIAHPTSALVGKPGVPDYVRQAAEVHWDEIFSACARWRVAVELNCFPSRLDLPLPLLRDAASYGCAISLGSDSHARSHLLNLRYGGEALRLLAVDVVLNRFRFDELKDYLQDARSARQGLSRGRVGFVQPEFQFESDISPMSFSVRARIQAPQPIPGGSRVIGIDLTAGDKPTGLALLEDTDVETCSLRTDEQILEYIAAHQPSIVSIDSPLGLPGGGDEIGTSSGIVRVAEQDLASIGIPAYPALIDSMAKLTLRGIRLRKLIEDTGRTVIESYPGAAQDILCLPRKQRGLELLREGLSRLGLSGTGLRTCSHDEMDAITAAIVARYYESRSFEPMGVPAEAQLIVPKASPIVFDEPPVICLAGKTGAGKSVAARYLAVFYGFTWLKTRDVIRELLLEDLSRPIQSRCLRREVDPLNITEDDLRDFGAVVLREYKQEPLRDRVTRRVASVRSAVVVDSIRDVIDVDRRLLNRRPMAIWYVDCPDGIIRERLARRSKLGQRRATSPSPVDQTAEAIKRVSTARIPNAGSLEELRWRIDDTLFAALDICPGRSIAV